MKLEVGNYVRTIDGFLWKPKKIEIDEDGCYLFDDYYYFEPEQIYKSSNNIIDLIEEGDYVNGTIVTTKTPNKYIELDYSYNRKGCYEEDIKTVVTKEQFESMQYKID